MGAILEQLGLDQTFFVQLVVFAVLFLILSQTYFRPFMKLFEARHKRTVEDRQAAEQMMSQAETKFEEYKRRLNDERLAARKDYETILTDTKKEEANILAQAREEAKKITQDAVESAGKQRQAIRKQLEADVDQLAKQISETLLLRKE